ncbi:MAG: hypothetical protein RLZZ15_4622 [Verrucomicrobiota bacterium]
MEGRGEPGGGDGPEEVVERVDLEGAEGVGLVGGDENDARAGLHVGHQIEGVAADELDVEQHEIVVDGGEEGAGGTDGRGLADDHELGVRGEFGAEIGAGGGFVFDEERAGHGG